MLKLVMDIEIIDHVIRRSMRESTDVIPRDGKDLSLSRLSLDIDVAKTAMISIEKFVHSL